MEGTARRDWNNEGRNQGGTRRRCRSEVRGEVMKDRLREASESAVMRKGDVGSGVLLSRDGRGGTVQSLELQDYEKEFTKVICPFCYSLQKNKEKMAKHLVGNCRKWHNPLPASSASSACKVQLDLEQTFFCSLCSYSGQSWEGCLVHIYSLSHTKKCREATNIRDMLQFLFCSFCKVYIPCTYIQIKFHLEHENHKVRTESSLDLSHYLSRGINSIYCLENNTLKVKCLSCPNASIYNYTAMIKHVLAAKHEASTQTMYCCLCHEEVFLVEGSSHFTSKGHIKRKKQLFLKDDYKLCFYCGFTCETLGELLCHMKSNCTETRTILAGAKANIKKTTFKEEEKAEVAAGFEALHLDNERKDAAFRPENQEEIDKRRCILVKADTDVVELFLIMKKFGKITFVGMYDEEYLVMKFSSKEAVTNINLVQRFIEVNEQKVEIKFF